MNIGLIKKHNESKRWMLVKKKHFISSVGEPFTKKTRATNIQKPKKRNR
jgi:hypothetical protein